MDVVYVVVNGAKGLVSYRLANGVLEVWVDEPAQPDQPVKSDMGQPAQVKNGKHWIVLDARVQRPGVGRMQRPARGRVQPRQ